jgi:proline iminopeptidase
VFGPSFGGFVAQRYLARHPDHPAKVILACTGVALDIELAVAAFSRFGGEHAANVARRFWTGDDDPEVGMDYYKVCTPLYTTGQFRPERFSRMVQNFDVIAHFNRGEQATMNLAPGLAHAKCPVLVLGGERDPVLPIEASQQVVAALPAPLVTFHQIDGASHYEAYSGHEAVALIRSFITSA